MDFPLRKALQVCALAGAALLLVNTVSAQEAYRLPPQEVIDLVDAAPTPRVSISPDGQWMLMQERGSLPTIEDLSRPMLRLAGMRIDPVANSRHATSFTRGLILRPLNGESAKEVRIPMRNDAPRIGSVSWSHNSERFAYTLVTDDGTQLWAVSVDDADSPTQITQRLSTVLGGFRWMPDGETLLCNLVPENRGPEPQAPRVPKGPNVQETSGNLSPLRTYQDLLANPYDEALFEYYATSELAMIHADGGKPQRIVEAAVWRGASIAPDGQRLLLTRVERPYSYLMPMWSFPHQISVLDLESARQRIIDEVPLAEGIPIGGVREGRRSIQWHPTEPATLVWVEALDQGDPKVEVPHRDRWMQQSAPFDDGAAEFARVEHRSQGLSWFADGLRFTTGEFDRDRRWTRTLLHDRRTPDADPVVLDDRSRNDRYADPGRLLSDTDERGFRVIREDNGWAYRTGSGASSQGNLPFLDRQNLSTGESERLWRCEAGSYESVTRLMDREAGTPLSFVTVHETPDMPPNYWWRTIGGSRAQLTSFPDPQPQLRGIHKELVKYTRSDGVPLSATLYLPADYEKGQKLPLFVWAYPQEFNNASDAGQISGSPWRFTRIASSSHLHLLTQGYAILDGATMPVIGDPETMNDTFVEQIVSSAAAAIDFAVDLGVADRNRVACGGHSYGAFMTANLLAHCDLFRTGIARSGAYNRTLTPFGFQSERRTFWEAPEAYFKVAPFMHAHKINEPILMIHGEKDNNSGTFPMQSRRMFQAIKGNGGTARLVMLPNESHGYRARESVLHTLAEMIDWLDLQMGETQAAPASAPR